MESIPITITDQNGGVTEWVETPPCAKPPVRSIRCDFSPADYDRIQAAAKIDDRAMKRFCERAILESAQVAMVPKTRIVLHASQAVATCPTPVIGEAVYMRLEDGRWCPASLNDEPLIWGKNWAMSP